MCFPCDSIRFARAGHVFRPQPSMLAPVLYTHPPQLGISRRSRAQSSRQASWTRCAKQKMAVLPFDATARRPATCVPTETRRRRRAWFPLARARHARATMDSSTTAVAHRATGDLHERPGSASARTRYQRSRPVRRRHRRWPRGSCLAAGGEAACGAQSAPGGRFTRSLLAGRAPRARYSA